MADATDSVFEAMAEDPDRETLGRLLTAWQSQFGKTPAMVRDAVKQAAASLDEHAELREVLHDIAGDRGEINRRKLGWWIKRHAGRIVDGQRFVRASGNRSAEAWRVESVPSVSSVSGARSDKSVNGTASSAPAATSNSAQGFAAPRPSHIEPMEGDTKTLGDAVDEDTELVI